MGEKPSFARSMKARQGINKTLKTALNDAPAVIATQQAKDINTQTALPVAPPAPSTLVEAATENKQLQQVITTQPSEQTKETPIQTAPPATPPQQSSLPETTSNQKPNTAPADEEGFAEEMNEPEKKAPTAVVQKTKHKNKFILNFENVDLLSFVKEMADLKKINFIPAKELEGNKISLNIRNPVTLDKAWSILQTVLRSANFVMIQEGNVWKIAPRAGATHEPLTYIGVNPDNIPNSDVMVRYIALLQNLKVTDDSIRGLLESMLGDPKTLIAQPDINAFIIADSGYNIKAAIRVLRELDQSGKPEMIEVIRLQESNAAQVKSILDTLIGKSDEQHPLAQLLRRKTDNVGSYFSKGTRIVADERTNSLYLLGVQESIARIEAFIKENFERRLLSQENVESPLKVYELQYADATQIAQILTEAIAPPDTELGQKASQYGYVLGGVKYFRKGMKIKADPDGNRLLVWSDDLNDWKLLKKTIKSLDIPQPQVAIETLIINVVSDDMREMGGQVRNKKHGMLGRGIDFQSTPIHSTIFEKDLANNPISLLGNLIQGLAGGVGQTLLTFGCESNIWGIFRILDSISKLSVVAQPFLSIANKYKANIVIGDSKRIVSATTGDISGFESIDALIDLKITPRINLDGVIDLKIDLTDDDFLNTAGTNMTKRNLVTNVSVADGQVLVIGGFTRLRVNEATTKVPILGDIPILGWLFKNKVKEIVKNHLLIFMSPTIIRPRSKPGANLYTQMKLDEARYWYDSVVPPAKSNDPLNDWFFDSAGTRFGKKLEDFSTGRYQPVTVDMKNDPYYRSKTITQEILEKENPKKPAPRKSTAVVAENDAQKVMKLNRKKQQSDRRIVT